MRIRRFVEATLRVNGEVDEHSERKGLEDLVPCSVTKEDRAGFVSVTDILVQRTPEEDRSLVFFGVIQMLSGVSVEDRLFISGV